MRLSLERCENGSSDYANWGECCIAHIDMPHLPNEFSNVRFALITEQMEPRRMFNRLHLSLDAIRPARLSDYSAINAMRQDLSRQSHRERPDAFRPQLLGATEATFHQWLNIENHIVLVADAEGEVAGYVTIWIGGAQDSDVMFPSESIFIGELAVASTHRRRGVGRLLFAAVEAEGRNRNVETIGLSVNSLNDEARAFYESLGYLAQGEYRRKVMRKVVRIENPQ
jgi:diamine N-acetyltransferase